MPTASAVLAASSSATAASAPPSLQNLSPPRALPGSAASAASAYWNYAPVAPLTAARPPAEAAMPPGCPRTEPGWVKWRDRAIGELLKPRNHLEDRDGPLLDPDQVIGQAAAIANVFADCAEAASDGMKLVLGNLKRFAETLRNQADILHQFGHGIEDLTYLDRIRAPSKNIAPKLADLPPLLTSPDFLRKISNKSTYQAAFQSILDQNKTLPKEKEWQVLIYRSAVLGTPDHSGTFGRFFVLVPGDEYDQWIQFGIQTPDDTQPGEPINNVSVVSIAKAARPGFVAIMDWWRTYGDSGDISLLSRRQATGVTGNCLNCHKTGPIGIHPEMVYVFSGNDLVRADQPWTLPTELNKRVMSYPAPEFVASPDYGSADDQLASAGNYGPDLGPRTKVRTDAFMKTCTAGLSLPPAAVENVRANMKCAKCHEEGSHGSLNFPMATQATTAYRLTDYTWPNLIHNYIMNGTMPMTKDGTPALHTVAERQGLYNCLMREYYRPSSPPRGLLVDWLKSLPEPSQTQGQAGRSSLSRGQQSASGAAAFEAECSDCHSVPSDATDAGPNLAKVFNRTAGSVAGYPYSVTMSEAGNQVPPLVWTESSLLQFLSSPDAFLTKFLHHTAKTKMKHSVGNAAVRQQIVDYLKTLN